MSAPSAINNARQIIIGGTAALGVGTNLQSAAFRAATGEVGIFSKEGTRIVAGTATVGREYVIAVSRGANLAPLVSDLIDGSRVTVASSALGAAATEQSTAVGYDGTSGLIADVATYAGELYKVSILVHQFLSGTDSEHLKAGYYQSQLTDGQAEIALGIAASVIKNFSREVSNVNGQKPIRCKAVCNNAGIVAAGAATGTIATNSTQLAMNAVITSGGVPIIVGSYIKLNEDVTGAMALNDPTFRVTAIDGFTYTLDHEYQGTAMAATAVANNIFTITAPLGAAANWGVILDGSALPFNRNKRRYAKCRFDVVLDTAFGSTAVNDVTAASEGVGTFQAISELENFLVRMMSESYEMGQPFVDNIDDQLLAAAAVAGGTYSLVTIKWSQNEVVSFQNEVSLKELIIATPFTTPAYADVANGFNTLMATISPTALTGADLNV